jgi:hypothetical protein
MLRSLAFRAIACIPLIVLALPSLAQVLLQEHLFKYLAESRIDEIREGPDQVMVRGGRVEAKGRTPTGFLIGCVRASAGREYMIYTDFELKTDDRWGAEPGTCDALLVAASKRKDVQGQ